MKLGRIMVHHYAHQEEIKCPVTQPETALHLNTKFYLYKQLFAGTRLYLSQECVNRCGNSRVVVWAKDWDKVMIESSLGKYRPDILIIGRSGERYVIEIKVTHSVEEDKAALYKDNNITWLEVDVSEISESFYEGVNPWRINKPLPHAVSEPPLSQWTCDACLSKLKREEYRKHNYEDILYSKLVDFYFYSGKKYRESFYLKKVIRNDKPVGMLVQRKSDGEIIFNREGVDDSILTSAFKSTELDTRRAVAKIISDWDWLPWTRGKKYNTFNIEQYPYLYKWDAGTREWEKQERQILNLECDHNLVPYYEGGAVCKLCGTIIRSQSDCTHYFINGICKWCGKFDELGYYGEKQNYTSPEF